METQEQADDFLCERIIPDPECIDCHRTMDLEHESNGFPMCRICARKRARRERVKAVDNGGRLIPYYVAAIAVSRAYGGPEEGGWWYDVTQVVEVRRAYDLAQGLRFARELRAEHPTCPRGRHSVIGGDDIYIQTFRFLSDLPDERFEKPRYE